MPGGGSLAVLDDADDAEFVFTPEGGAASKRLPRLASGSAIQQVAATALESGRSQGSDLIVEAIDSAGKKWALLWPDFPDGAPAQSWSDGDVLPLRLDAEPGRGPRA